MFADRAKLVAKMLKRHEATRKRHMATVNNMKRQNHMTARDYADVTNETGMVECLKYPQREGDGGKGCENEP